MDRSLVAINRHFYRNGKGSSIKEAPKQRRDGHSINADVCREARVLCGRPHSNFVHYTLTLTLNGIDCPKLYSLHKP